MELGVLALATVVDVAPRSPRNREQAHPSISIHTILIISRHSCIKNVAMNDLMTY